MLGVFVLQSSDKTPYLQVTWPGFAKRVTKIGTWGAGPAKNAYVTRYKLAFSDDGQVFTEYQEKGISRVRRGAFVTSYSCLGTKMENKSILFFIL